MQKREMDYQNSRGTIGGMENEALGRRIVESEAWNLKKMRLKVEHCCRNWKRMIEKGARDRDVSPNWLAAQLAITRDTWRAFLLVSDSQVIFISIVSRLSRQNLNIRLMFTLF